MKFLTREGISAVKRKELDWTGIHYLQNEAVSLELPVPASGEQQARRIKIYGSPMTPEFGRWAFQYPSIRDVWSGRIPDDTDILVVHGPPALYGDCDGEKGPDGKAKVKGDGYLLREIQRVRPQDGCLWAYPRGIWCCCHPPRWNRGRYEWTSDAMGRLQYTWSSQTEHMEQGHYGEEC